MHIIQSKVQGNSNVGLYGFANNKFALIGMDFTAEQAIEFEEALGVPVHRITIAGT